MKWKLWIITPRRINEIELGKRRISADTAFRLAESMAAYFLGITRFLQHGSAQMKPLGNAILFIW